MEAPTVERTPATSAEVIVCPECAKQGIDRAFGTAQALAVHRYRSHGVRGQSRGHGHSNGNGKEKKDGAETATTTTTTGRRTTTRGQTTRPTTARKRGGVRNRRRRQVTPVAEVQAFPTDAVLKAVFPHGIPASGDMLTRVQTWLSQGEELAGVPVTNGRSKR